jgi:hypothetical protein
MEDLKSAARIVRWIAVNFIHNLSFIPEDKLTWKPEPIVKSPLEIAGEVTGAFQAMLPILQGGDWAHRELDHPASFAQAKERLTAAAEAYAAALESADRAAMDRMVEIFHMKVWAPRAVLLPVIDAVHHHGQITYIQSLLGDAEYHFDMESAGRFFARPESAGGEQ